MTDEKIARINFLAKKSREEGLSAREKEEQLALRQEYLREIRQSLTTQLENTYLVDGEGNQEKLKRRS